MVMDRGPRYAPLQEGQKCSGAALPSGSSRERELNAGGVVIWCGVVWCGVAWRGVAWCSVVWCGVVHVC